MEQEVWLTSGGAFLAALAGLIHFVMAPEHFADGVAAGALMVLVGAAQLAAGALLLVHPARAVVLATLLGAVAVFAIFAFVHAVGLPGGQDHPHAGAHLAELSPMTIVSRLTELALVVTLSALAVARRRDSTAEEGVQMG